MSLSAETGTPVALPKRAMPWWFALLAVLAAVGVGIAATDLKLFFLILVAVGAVYVLVRAFKDPWFALTVTFALYPLIPSARALHNVYDLPIFTSGVRCFPELFQAIIILHLIVREIRERASGVKKKWLKKWLTITYDDLPVVVYLVVAMYSFVIGWLYVHPLAPLNGWFVSVTPFVFYLVIRWLRPTEQQSHRLLRWIVIVYSILAVVSLVDYFLKTDIGIKMANSERPYFVPAGVPAEGYWRLYPRLQSFIFEENFFGELSNMMVLLTAAYLLHRRPRWFYYPFFLLALISLILTISRGAYMSLVVGLSVLLLQRSRHRKQALMIIGVIMVAAVIALLTIKDVPIFLRIADRLDTLTVSNAESGSLTSDRMHHWQRGWEIFTSYPSGSGLGTAGYAAHLSGVIAQSIGEGIFFRVLAEQGVPGILAFVYLLVSIFWILWRYLPICGPKMRPLGAAMLAFHTGFVIHSAAASTYDYYFVVPVYCVFISLFVSGTYRHLEEQKTLQLQQKETALVVAS